MGKWVSWGMTLALAVFAAPAAFGTVSQDAVWIDFDDLDAPALFSEATPLREEYASLGVHFDGVGVFAGGAVLHQDSNFGVDAHTGTNFLAFNRRAGFAGPHKSSSISARRTYRCTSRGDSPRPNSSWSATTRTDRSSGRRR